MTAVIFDCDGTLVDSEPLARRAWERALGAHGYTISDEDFAAVVGLAYPRVHAFFAERARGAGAHLPDADTFRPEFTGELFALIDSELKPFPDAVATLAELEARGIPLAVASSSERDRLDRTLRGAGLEPAYTVAGDEVEHGKPAPDLFLAAAERLGVPAAECIVVEDMPPGVEAGLAAGAAVVAVARPSHARDGLAGAHAIVAELSAAEVLAAARSG